MNVEEFHLLKRLLHHGFWNGLAVWIAALRSLYRHHVIGGSEFCGQKSRTKDEGGTIIHNSDSFQSFASRGIYPRPSQIRISFYYGLGALRRAREGRTLLKNLRENIFECYRCAEACRHNATEQRNPGKTSWIVNGAGFCWPEVVNKNRPSTPRLSNKLSNEPPTLKRAA